MRASLDALRAVFGPRCRYGINALSNTSELPRTVYVTARWECGCIGTGASYQWLTLLPCRVHFADVLEDLPVR